MARTLTLEIATPEGLALSTEADMVTAPSVAGEFGVLPDHLPLLAATRAGVVRYDVGDKQLFAAVGPGFVEAGPDKFLMLTDSFVKPADVKKEKVEQELAEAELALKNLAESTDSHHAQELQRKIEWAQARLTAAAAGAAH